MSTTNREQGKIIFCPQEEACCRSQRPRGRNRRSTAARPGA